MSAGDVSADLPLVAGRSCGECNVCCVALTIDDPELQKVQGYRCPHAQADHSCGIYATRPQACRAFYCGWRRLKWVREPLRPDRSGVLIRLHGEISRKDGSRRLGVMITLLNRAALKAEGLAETVAAAISAEVPVWLHIPGPPGHTAAQARLNDALREPVRARDKAAVLRILREGYAIGRAGEFRPITLAREGAVSRS
jgi:hypothetical protein